MRISHGWQDGRTILFAQSILEVVGDRLMGAVDGPVSSLQMLQTKTMLAAVAVLLQPFALVLWAQTGAGSNKDWPAYGGDAGGQRYSTRRQIDRSNVASLQLAWTFHTGSLQKASAASNGRANFEATPVLWNNTLYFDTPFDAVFAIDAATGQKRWSFDPEVNREGGIYIVSSRGVGLWHGKGPATEPCGQDRVFVATLDRRLMARDARTGLACEQFGVHGTVDLAAGMGLTAATKGFYGFTSPPTVVGDVVVLGSSIADNQTVDVPNGAVRGFDVRTGRLVWSWDPIPWSAQTRPRAGGGNAWSVLAADGERDLVFVPTGSPATDFFGGLRPGDNRDADSLVALRASTGQRVWGFQLVHHDLWDYDTPSQPLLFTFRGKIPAVAITGKTGMVFVFNRVTGEPLYPVEERAVPQSDLPGEKSSATQPFSTLPTLGPLSFGPNDIKLTNAADTDFCHKALSAVVNKGIFTPPSERSTLLYPGSLGGANWGSAGIDPATGTMYVHTNSFAYVLRQNSKDDSLVNRMERYARRHAPSWISNAETNPQSRYRTPDGAEVTPQAGTPYELYREPLTTAAGVPCAPQPWGALVAINLNTGTKSWSVPQGTMVAGQQTGSIGMGGPAVTAGGLVFIGATLESMLRGFDAATGKVLWEAKLPAAASATPMTYEVGGRQYVVVAAGGEGMLGTQQGDTVLAFALPVMPATNKSASSKRHR